MTLLRRLRQEDQALREEPIVDPFVNISLDDPVGFRCKRPVPWTCVAADLQVAAQFIRQPGEIFERLSLIHRLRCVR